MARQIIRGGASIVENLVKEVQKQGGTAEDVRYLTTHEGERFVTFIASLLVSYRRKSAMASKPRESRDGKPPIGKPFMTVALGECGSYDDYREAITNLGRDIEMPKGDFDAIFSEPIRREVLKLDLYEVTGAELGFSQVEYAETIWAELKKRGFAPCPAEATLVALVGYSDEEARKFYMERSDLFRAGARVFLGLRTDGKGKHLSIVEDRIPFKPSRKWIAVWPRIAPEGHGFLF